jgi:Holliday junction resolvasome RuvABC endonuclease subunit
VKITGLDLSLTKTGVAHTWVGGPTHGLALAAEIAPHARLGKDHLRLEFLLEEVGTHVRQSDLVMIEQLAFSQSTNQASQIDGLHWMVRHGLWRRKVPYVIVTPQHLKIYALGRARPVTKDQVLAAVIKRYKAVDVPGNDGADALVLAAIAADWMGSPLTEMPESHRRALRMMKWPESALDLKETCSGRQAAG